MLSGRFINWGHRGSSGHAPENTLAAFHLAVQMGANGIECDLRESQDGQLIVFHDPTLKRIASRPEAVRHLSVKELKRIDIGSWFSNRYKGERIPTLFQLIEQIPSPTLLNLEIKKVTPKKMLDMVYKYNAQGRVLFSSFDYKVLNRIRSLDSSAAIGYLVEEGVTGAVIQRAREMQAISVHLSWKKVTPKTIHRIHEAGFLVHSYTVNEVDQMTRLVEMGLDGCFTNYPDRLSTLRGKEKGLC
jgi:glycerophosphoryl diester phosphodiesterase